MTICKNDIKKKKKKKKHLLIFFKMALNIPWYFQVFHGCRNYICLNVNLKHGNSEVEWWSNSKCCFDHI